MVSHGSLWLFLTIGMMSSALLAMGLLMMKSRSEALPAARGTGAPGAILHWLRDPIWLGGLGVETAGYALYVIAVAAAPVSIIAVMMQGGIALFVLFGAIFLDERARPREWAGIGGIVLAMLMLAWSIESGAAQGGADSLALMILTGVAVAAGAAPSIDVRLRTSGTAAALASGIAFGLGSLYIKAMAADFAGSTAIKVAGLIFANPWLYLAIVANLAGLVMLQNAFHHTRGIIAMPLSSACSTVIPIVGGMVAFGERLPLDSVAKAMRIGAFVLTIGAGALLAAADPESRVPGLAQTRRA